MADQEAADRLTDAEMVEAEEYWRRYAVAEFYHQEPAKTVIAKLVWFNEEHARLTQERDTLKEENARLKAGRDSTFAGEWIGRHLGMGHTLTHVPDRGYDCSCGSTLWLHFNEETTT